MVRNKNDAPLILKSTFRMPLPLPYKWSEVSTVSSSGSTVADVLGTGGVRDADGDPIGKKGVLNLPEYIFHVRLIFYYPYY